MKFISPAPGQNKLLDWQTFSAFLISPNHIHWYKQLKADYHSFNSRGFSGICVTWISENASKVGCGGSHSILCTLDSKFLKVGLYKTGTETDA